MECCLAWCPVGLTPSPLAQKRLACASCPSFRTALLLLAQFRRCGILCNRLCRSRLARLCASAVVHRH
eukprot:16090898-Heterocapsa_arctica.AAC.1